MPDTIILMLEVFVFTSGMVLKSNPVWIRILSGITLFLILFTEAMKYYG